MEALVLVQNEVTCDEQYECWEDQTGVRYHFPNKYKGKVQKGKAFIYYRGSRRSGGIGSPEYFGLGRIGEVSLDPRTADGPKLLRRWFCDIEDYVPFVKPVLAKINGSYIEDVKHSNAWQMGVRRIDEEIFRRICELANLGAETIAEGWGDKQHYEENPFPLLDLEHVSPVLVHTATDLFIRRRSFRQKGENYNGIPCRRHPQAKKIGDRAEKIVLEWLKSTLPKEEAQTIRWVAKEGETPGWDIEFTDRSGNLVSVEVKGTTGKIFADIEITAQEWSAARVREKNYHLALVADCMGSNPKIGVIENPFAALPYSEYEVEPLLFRIRKISD